MARSKTTLKSLERRISNMSTTKRKRRRKTARRRTSALSAPRRHHTRRRRRKGFLHDKGGLMTSLKANGAGALGGALVLGLDMVPLKSWMKLSLGVAASIGASMFNAPNVGAGIAGATAYSAGKTFFPNLLHDNLEDAQYVDPSTLSDSGYVDGNGNAVVQDHEGVMYALSDSGDLQAIGDAYALNDGTNLNSVSGLPLSDAYSLSDDRFTL